MTFTLALGGSVALELLAQLQLLELARCGHRDGLDELVGVGQPELREVLFEVDVKLVLRSALAFLEDNGGQGPLVPRLVGDGDHTGLGDGGVGHKRVLQLDRGDPLPPALYEVLAAVGDFDKPKAVYGDDVPGLEPAVVRELVVPLGRLVVRPRDPGTAHLELAHRFAVPRDQALVPAGAYLHERYGIALLGLVLELLLLGELLHLGRQVGHGPYGAHLRHAPGVDDLYPMPLLVISYYALGRRRPPDDHRPQLGKVVPLRFRIQRLQHREEDGRNTGRERHLFLL